MGFFSRKKDMDAALASSREMMQKSLETLDQLQAQLQEQQATIEAQKAELEATKADCERYREEAKRYRTEANNALKGARAAAAAASLPEQKKAWVTEGIPTLPNPCNTYDAGENAYLLYHDKSNRSEFDNYCTALENAGFTKHCTEEMGLGIHSFYFDRKAVISVSFSQHDQVLRAVVEPVGDTKLAPLGTICDGTPDSAKPCFVQMNDHLNDVVDCGMSYIFRLSDNSFILMDGGWDTEPIADALYNKLRALAGEGDIIISAWFFTHAHVDHIGAFYPFARKYGDKVTLKRVIYNYPGESRITEMGDEFVRGYVRNFRRTLALFGDVDVIKARTGQRFHFQGLDLDQLFTYEDYMMPRPLRTFNDTSLALLIKTADETFFFPGDASETMSGILVRKYGEGLKSDIIQVAHHGYGGGTKELYDTAKAPIVFWPVPADHPKTGAPRYSNPEWSPITREMIRDHATVVYPQCEGTKTFLLPVRDGKEI
ncbi:MAG: MBL fold metallo-hydrolase [Clostridia bacterium]|nr:MBL fold metallo-hydrolase [Clostridia bacterium]